MLALSEIKGQNNAVRYLTKCLSSGRITNGYLFTGPEGVGKALTARAFISSLICPDRDQHRRPCMVCSSCRRIEAMEHPDVKWVLPEKKENVKKKSVKIEQIRNVIEVLSLKPYEAPLIACVIEDAHLMTTEAANALLKVLEEPPGNAMIILLTSKKELLLPTVISRCSEVRFLPLAVGDTRDIIMSGSPGIGEETATFLAYFSQGSPGAALSMIEEDLESRKNEILDLMELILQSKLGSCMIWDTNDAEQIAKDLEILIMLLRDAAVAREGTYESVLNKGITSADVFRIFEGYSIDKIYQIAERAITLKFALSGNVNPKLVAQALPGMLK